MVIELDVEQASDTVVAGEGGDLNVGETFGGAGGDDLAVDDGAVVLVVAVVLGVEADDRRIRHSRPREQDRARREAAGQLRQRVDVRIVPHVVLRVRPLGGEIERIHRGLATEQVLVGVVVHVEGVGIVRLHLEARRHAPGERRGERVVARARGRFVDREDADRGIRPDGVEDRHAGAVAERRIQIPVEPPLQVPRVAVHVADRNRDRVSDEPLEGRGALQRPRVLEVRIEAEYARRSHFDARRHGGQCIGERQRVQHDGIEFAVDRNGGDAVVGEHALEQRCRRAGDVDTP